MTNDEASHEDETTMKLYEQDEDDGLDDEDEFPLDENALGIMHYATITQGQFVGLIALKINIDFFTFLFRLNLARIK